jgi:hemerythrin-like domain-containing protein
MTTQTEAASAIKCRFQLDHRKIEDLLWQVLLAFEDGDRESAAAVWSLFDAQLQAHMDAEERHLTPLLMRSNERACRALLEEHKHLRARLVELGTGVDLHVIRLADARTFIDELRAHAASEDKILYELADAQVAPAGRDAIVEALKAKVRASATKVA